jgi:hypothetical protein
VFAIAIDRADHAATVITRSLAISLKLSQNSSSTLTLVLWPAMTIERFKTGDTASGLALLTRKTPGLGATGGYRSVAVAV